MRILHILAATVLFAYPVPAGQRQRLEGGKMMVALVINPYNGDRAGPELNDHAAAMAKGNLAEVLAGTGAVVTRTSTVALSAEDEKEYGRWNRFGHANKHLADFVAANERDGFLSIGLLNNCSSAVGILGGLQHGGAGDKALKVGLVWIDAHADFNTPETTLSGMLGGMPVAVAAGHCLARLRVQSGLDPALPVDRIVMACVRDTDPLERERIDKYAIQRLNINDVRGHSTNMTQQMGRLSRLADVIYVHVDLDVLDPQEVPGHPLKVPDGPTSGELAEALSGMFRYEKVAALGIASYPADADPELITLRAVHRLVLGALKGAQSR